MAIEDDKDKVEDIVEADDNDILDGEPGPAFSRRGREIRRLSRYD